MFDFFMGLKTYKTWRFLHLIILLFWEEMVESQ